MKAIVVINIKHSLMAGQTSILKEKFDEVELLQVPDGGWDLPKIREMSNRLVDAIERNCYFEEASVHVVFASPIPAMMKLVFAGLDDAINCVHVFHNDVREKEELPNGNIIMRVSAEGWQLI